MHAHDADREFARARAALLATHAQLVESIAGRLRDRLSTDRIVELYCQELDLAEFEEIWLRIHTVAHVGSGRSPGSGTDHDHAVHRAWHMLLDELRLRVAPYGDADLRERLAYEFAAARAIVLKVHVRNAIHAAEALQPRLSGPAAVAHYISALDVAPRLSGAVYAFAVAQIGAARVAGILGTGVDAVLPGEVPAEPAGAA